MLCLINEGETALIDSSSDVVLSWDIFMSCKLFYAVSNHVSKLKSYQRGLGINYHLNQSDGRREGGKKTFVQGVMRSYENQLGLVLLCNN